jgi:hypothetical protein
MDLKSTKHFSFSVPSPLFLPIFSFILSFLPSFLPSFPSSRIFESAEEVTTQQQKQLGQNYSVDGEFHSKHCQKPK